LLDKGFAQTDFPVWQVPVALIGLFGLRGMGVFLSHIALAKADFIFNPSISWSIASNLLTASSHLFIPAKAKIPGICV
jgi:subfamily B ATP-binding cassette protein MsbA